MREHRTGSIPCHCVNTRCRKCQTRIRWYRRKAWRTHKSPIRMLNGRK